MVSLLGDDGAPWMSVNFMEFLTAQNSSFPEDAVAILGPDKRVRLITTCERRAVVAIFSREAWRHFNRVREAYEEDF